MSLLHILYTNALTASQASPFPPVGQYGHPGGAPAGPATDQEVAAYRQLLVNAIQEKHLQSFYPPDRLDRIVGQLAYEAPSKINRLVQEWGIPVEIATDVMKLALFDVILFVDDSGSIEFEERGVRKDQLKQILGIIATGASAFDQDGISVRFMNSSQLGDQICNPGDVDRLVSCVTFSGATPLGTNLERKVLKPMVVGPAKEYRLNKPVLIITITDGQPTGEPLESVANAVQYAAEAVSQGAVSFQFSQVGNDQKAREFLASLDGNHDIGGFIDCTSSKSCPGSQVRSTDVFQISSSNKKKCPELTLRFT